MSKEIRKTYISLFIFMLLPFIVDVVKMRLLIAVPDNSRFSISGHIEWFDLINETLQAFLIIPLYRIFSKYKNNIKKVLSFILFTATIVYIIFSFVVQLYIEYIADIMGANGVLVLRYLRLETIAFVIGFIASIATAYFVSNNEYKVMWTQIILKIICFVVVFSIFIPKYGVNGIAYGNMLINGVFTISFLILLVKRKLFSKIVFDKKLVMEWCKLGLFSGGEILLNNVIYALIVCRMVNAVSLQGIYWAINNVIWNFFLIPFLAMNEIVKTQIDDNIKILFKYWKNVLVITYIAWILCYIASPIVISATTGMNDKISISLFRLLVVYYLVYGFTALFDGYFVAKGKTIYLFYISLIVNIVYYGIVYILFLNKVFELNINFIAHMFGIGMVVHLVLDVLLSSLYCKKQIYSV